MSLKSPAASVTVFLSLPILVCVLHTVQATNTLEWLGETKKANNINPNKNMVPGQNGFTPSKNYPNQPFYFLMDYTGCR
jgi:hypothetical protein